MNLLIKT